MEYLTVKSHAGTKAEEHPLRFFSNKRKIEITSIEKRWLTPDGRCFKVTGNDGWLYILKYNPGNDIWSLVAIDRP
jgi:hypothetical protein